jgi:hypothetical protein
VILHGKLIKQKDGKLPHARRVLRTLNLFIELVDELTQIIDGGLLGLVRRPLIGGLVGLGALAVGARRAFLALVGGRFERIQQIIIIDGFRIGGGHLPLLLGSADPETLLIAHDRWLISGRSHSEYCRRGFFGGEYRSHELNRLSMVRQLSGQDHELFPAQGAIQLRLGRQLIRAGNLASYLGGVLLQLVRVQLTHT